MGCLKDVKRLLSMFSMIGRCLNCRTCQTHRQIHHTTDTHTTTPRHTLHHTHTHTHTHTHMHTHTHTHILPYTYMYTMFNWSIPGWSSYYSPWGSEAFRKTLIGVHCWGLTLSIPNFLDVLFKAIYRIEGNYYCSKLKFSPSLPSYPTCIWGYITMAVVTLELKSELITKECLFSTLNR